MPVTIDIDPEGDLLLSTASNHKRFRVSSPVLRLQSPVFKRMLFGSWKESKPEDEEEWIVELPEDSARPLQTVLYIMHCKFEVVPTKPDRRFIYNVLATANKYDVTHLVRPWATQWQDVAKGPGRTPLSRVRTLYIAWELGDEPLFGYKLEQIAMRSKIDSEGRLVYGNIVLEDVTFLGPQTVLGKFHVKLTTSEPNTNSHSTEAIAEIRLKVIETLISSVHGALDTRMNPTPYCTHRNPKTASDCDAAVVGRIYRAMLQKRGELLPRSPSDIKESAADLATWIFGFMSQTEGIHHEISGHYYPRCSPKAEFGMLSSFLTLSLQHMVDYSMKPGCKEYMAKQRTKTGLILDETMGLIKRSWPEYWNHPW